MHNSENAIKFVGGLCLEIYLVQYPLFTPSQPAHHAAGNHRRRIRAALSGTDLRADVQGGGLLLERGVQGVLDK